MGLGGREAGRTVGGASGLASVPGAGRVCFFRGGGWEECQVRARRWGQAAWGLRACGVLGGALTEPGGGRRGCPFGGELVALFDWGRGVGGCREASGRACAVEAGAARAERARFGRKGPGEGPSEANGLSKLRAGKFLVRQPSRGELQDRPIERPHLPVVLVSELIARQHFVCVKYNAPRSRQSRGPRCSGPGN